ncbi:MAG: hypothetical protein NZZ41_04830 [Candidatus Dojkabacteria bacterium]|nr:hypothetical protein [Candidatus Dojkabacteria bacterium]
MTTIFSFFKSKEQKNKEVIQRALKKISNFYDEDKFNFSNKNFNDTYSLVIFVNEDFPFHKQLLGVVECSTEFLFNIGHSPDMMQWKERKNMVGKKDHIIIYMLDAQTMNQLYKEYYTSITNGIKPKNKIQTVSFIKYDEVIYPIAFCLGFLWTKDLKDFNENYRSIRMY